MNRHQLRKSGFALKGVATRMALPLALAACTLPSADASAGLQVGVDFTHRYGASFQITGGSRASASNITEISLTNVAPSGIGAATGTADRVYDNGFVKLDPGTNNSGAVGGAGNTWNWGYARAGQVNTDAKTLSLTRTDGYTGSVSTVATSANEECKDMDYKGFGLYVQGDVASLGPVHFSWKAGFDSFKTHGRSLSFSNFSRTYSTFTYYVVDTYSLAGLSTIPAAPYSGTYAGPGPVIGEVPTARKTTLLSTGSWSSQNTVTFDVDADLFDVYVAAPISFYASDSFSLGIEPSLHAMRASISINRSEIYYSGSKGNLAGWVDEGADNDLVLGAGIEAFMRIKIRKSLYATISYGYDKVFGSEHETVGPNDVKMDLSAYKASIGLGWEF